MNRTTKQKDDAHADSAFGRRVAFGFFLVAFLVLGIGGWAAWFSLSGAVIAPGQVVIESFLKKVQHPTGGIVGAILVKNGDHVEAGDVLLRLDDTQTRANLGVIVSQITEMTGRKARLAAVRDGAEKVQFPATFETESDEARHVADGEKRLFEAQRTAAEGQKSQLRERIGQARHEIEGLAKQEKAKARELTLVREELDRLETLYKQKLTPVTRLLAMQRDETRIEGEHGSILSQTARTLGQISETELKIIEVDETRRAEAQKELRELEARVSEYAERRIAAEDILRRIELKAPQAGIVHELAVHTIGGVIGPGDVVMSIVPTDDVKTVEVRLAPTDIDQVSIGQKAVLKFPAFNQRTTPELTGSISGLGADLTQDPKTGISFYVARIKVAEADLGAFNKMKLVPGMPVESFIQTGERTAISYFVKPISDQFARAFKEE